MQAVINSKIIAVEYLVQHTTITYNDLKSTLPALVAICTPYFENIAIMFCYWQASY